MGVCSQTDPQDPHPAHIRPHLSASDKSGGFFMLQKHPAHRWPGVLLISSEEPGACNCKRIREQTQLN
jgi:hypothetical protein